MHGIPFPWQPIGHAETEDLIQARLESHWAAQVLAAVADALLPRSDDDSHTNLFWNPNAGRLEGREIAVGTQGSEDTVRLALNLDPLALAVDEEAHPLAGRTLADAKAWAERRLATRATSSIRLQLRDYDMPEHVVEKGAPFAGSLDGARSELARWFENGTKALASVVRDLEGASEIAVWPHHFDVGGILFLDPSAPAERAPQVGLGLSPGDAHIGEPYFYVTPWPTEEGTVLEGLGVGRWFRAGFSGAVLDRQEIAAAGDAAAQGRMVAEFLNQAISKARAMVRIAIQGADS